MSDAGLERSRREDDIRERRRTLLGRIGSITAAAGAAFLVAGLVVSRDEIAGSLEAGDTGYIFASVLPLFVMQASTLGLAASMLAAHHQRSIATRDLYRILFAANLAKYVPGGVWQVGSQYQLTRAAGLKARGSLLLWVEMARANVAAMFLVAGVAFAVSDPGLTTRWVGLGGIVVALLVASPSGAHWLFAKLRIREEEQPLDARRWAAGLAAAVVSAAAVALHGFLLVSAFAPDVGIGIVDAFAVFPGAWVIGFVIFFVPGGLGVREATLVVLLSPWLETGTALGVAAASRLVFIAADAVGGVLAGMLALGRRRASSA